MVTLELLEMVKNGMNEIEEKSLEILKFKQKNDKNNLFKIKGLDEDIQYIKAKDISNLEIENNNVFITVDFCIYEEIIEVNYKITFEELTNDSWKEKFLKELRKLEIKSKIEKELEENKKIEQLLLKEKEEYKRLRKKFEEIYEENN